MGKSAFHKGSSATLSRRNFLKTSAAGVAVLAIGVDARGVLAATGTGSANMLNPFVEIGTDGSVTAVIKHFEGGQGVSTGLSALIAEELNMPLEKINWRHAPSDPATYGNFAFGGFQGTGGSTAMANSYLQYRQAGAAAREMLISAAAQEWGVDASEISLSDGSLTMGSNTASIGDFVEAAAALPVPAEPQLKAAEAFQIIGKDIRARRDTHDKINGEAIYSMDVQLPNQMVVVIARAPNLGAKLARFDASKAESLSGFIMAQAMPAGDGVAIYAEHTWAAFKAREAIDIEWDLSGAETRSSDQIKAELLAMVNTAPEFTATTVSAQDVEAQLAEADQIVERDFFVPMLAHAPMEPMGATIEPTDEGGLIVHDGAQGPTAVHQVMSQILELPMEKIQVNTLYAGGFFGRRLTPSSDYHVELALAFAMTDRTRPVKLVWSREDDITGGYYRPAMAHKVRVGLNAEGQIIAWDHRVAGQSIFKGTAFEPIMVQNGVDAASIEGIADGVYSVPNLHLGLTDANPSTTVNWWRSVGHSHTGFVMESMIDLVAQQAGIDPLDFRLAHLDETTTDGARMAQTLRLAADKAGWSTPLPEGRARGIAGHKSFGSYCAEVCEVSNQNGAIKIDSFTAAIDCGIAVTPDVVRAQIEGGIGYGVGAAMRNQITLEGGAVYERNFPDYEPLRMHDIGQIDVHIVPSDAAPTGVGEPGTPPAPAALANAIAALSGTRVTHLPMRDEVDFI